MASLLQVVELGYAYQILKFYYENDLFERFKDVVDPIQIAIDCGYDEDAFFEMFDYLYQKTDLFVLEGEGLFRLSTKYDSFGKFDHVLHKYIGAYDPCFDQLGVSLKNEFIGRDRIDQVTFSKAFDYDFDGVEMADFLHSHGKVLFDIGCGTGTLMRTFVQDTTDEYMAYGIDISNDMIERGKIRAEKQGLSDKVVFFAGDARRIADVVPSEIIGSVTLLFGGSIVNEFFKKGPEQAIEFLVQVRTLFPTQPFINSDYYGKLGKKATDQKKSATLLHDLIQTVSGQGIPSATVEQWDEIYERSGYTLSKIYELPNSKIDSFIHLVTPKTIIR